ncbi:LacI family DNA-binding transcriptional regulator [Paenarthrobacter ureafaciens]
MHHVAAAAGVSQATVSLVLNDVGGSQGLGGNPAARPSGRQGAGVPHQRPREGSPRRRR